jgi:hypothetical protein
VIHTQHGLSAISLRSCGPCAPVLSFVDVIMHESQRRNATRRGVSKEGPSSQDDDPSASAPAAAATRTSKAKAKKQIDSADETEEEPARPATRSAPAGKVSVFSNCCQLGLFVHGRVGVLSQKQPAAALPAAKTTPSKAQKRGPEALADDTLSESDTESDDTSKGKKTPVKKQAAAATPSSSKSNKTPRKAGTPKGKADGWGADLGASVSVSRVRVRFCHP